MMSAIKIPYLKELSPEAPLAGADQLINSGVMLNIDQRNWKDFPFQIGVTVSLGYSDHYLWLHYQVSGELVRVVCREDQEPVWQDSCVEFFIKQGKIYRNFEFNCLGVCLSAAGADRHERKSLEKEQMGRIRRFPSLDIENLPNEKVPVDWSLTIAIPLDLIGLQAGSRFMANLYKCADESTNPHYLSWNSINTPSPDFHRPEYFGCLELEN